MHTFRKKIAYFVVSSYLDFGQLSCPTPQIIAFHVGREGALFNFIFSKRKLSTKLPKPSKE